ncbi:MAG: alpha-amylase family glycosyl hydrolase [Anaerolineaceae bacterium]
MFDESGFISNLDLIYGENKAHELFSRLKNKVEEYNKKINVENKRYQLTQQDIILITYADQFNAEECKPLETLYKFCKEFLQSSFNTIHILPFFPSSSDDGFSVINYYQVDPALGDWEDIHAFSREFRLMIDGVFNHVSQENPWFQSFLKGEEPYRDYFITVPKSTDLLKVVRPRALPLLTSFGTDGGTVEVWTTFSKDQIDLNYASADVFLDIVDVMLFYVEQGAKFIRIDAVPFLWKEIGTDCIHRPQTHALVKAFRAILDWVAPEVLLITESNVPFKDNLPYLGSQIDTSDETDEAQLIYQFSLGPLILHTFLEGNSEKISNWIQSLPKPCRYLNFIASHDGIGLNPAMGILDEKEIDALIKTTREHGGKLSYKRDTDGKEKIYELNIALYDFLNDPKHPDLKKDIDRFIASQAIMLAVAGVPGVYIHSLFGSRNCIACDQDGNHPRSINRAKFSYGNVIAGLSNPQQRETIIFKRYQELLACRKEQTAFDPFAQQEVINIDDRVVVIYRENIRDKQGVICLTNVSDEQVNINLPATLIREGAALSDMISGKVFHKFEDIIPVSMQPYQTYWINN